MEIKYIKIPWIRRSNKCRRVDNNHFHLKCKFASSRSQMDYGNRVIIVCVCHSATLTCSIVIIFLFETIRELDLMGRLFSLHSAQCSIFEATICCRINDIRMSYYSLWIWINLPEHKWFETWFGGAAMRQMYVFRMPAAPTEYMSKCIKII